MMSKKRLHHILPDKIDCVKFITLSKATNEKPRVRELKTGSEILSIVIKPSKLIIELSSMLCTKAI